MELIQRALRVNSAFIVVLLVYVFIAYGVAAYFGLPLTLSLYSKMIAITTVALAGVAIPLVPLYWLLRYRPKKPTSFLAEKIGTARMGERLAIALPMIVLYPVFMSAFTSIKGGVGHIIPFYADNALAGIDQFVFPLSLFAFVQSPEIIAALDWLYLMWFPVNFAVFMIAAFSLDISRRTQYQLAFMLSWAILGSFGALVFASGGPFLFPGQRFANLISFLQKTSETAPLLAIREQAYLSRSYTSGALLIGSGISAFPSMHVALILLSTFYIWALNRVAGVAMAIYCFLIFIGSVMLGWHYSVDGYAAMIGTASIWWLSGRIANGRCWMLPFMTHTATG